MPGHSRPLICFLLYRFASSRTFTEMAPSDVSSFESGFLHVAWFSPLCFHQQCKRIGFNTYLQYCHFLVTAIAVSAKWYVTMTLTCFSQMTNDVEHLVMCLLAICIFYLVKFLLKPFPLFFKKNWVVFLLLSFKNSLYIQGTSLLPDV